MSSRSRNSGGSAGGGPGGGPPAGGVFPGGPGGFGDQGMSTTGTPQPGQANRSGGMGMNSMFVDPLIKLLQTSRQRAVNLSFHPGSSPGVY